MRASRSRHHRSKRRLASLLVFAGATALAVSLVALGCSTTPAAPAGCTSGTSAPCVCSSGGAGTQACGSAVCTCPNGDSGASGADGGDLDGGDVPGDATHKDEQQPPSVTYACAAHGSFGWPCEADASGPDPTDCTDPTFPICFVGAQGARCTAYCSDGSASACPLLGTDAGDSGCVPFDCNARGFCK